MPVQCSDYQLFIRPYLREALVLINCKALVLHKIYSGGSTPGFRIIQSLECARSTRSIKYNIISRLQSSSSFLKTKKSSLYYRPTGHLYSERLIQECIHLQLI